MNFVLFMNFADEKNGVPIGPRVIPIQSFTSSFHNYVTARFKILI